MKRTELEIPSLRTDRDVDRLIERLNADRYWRLETWTRAVLRALEAGWLSVDEIAVEFNTSPTAVRQVWFRAKGRAIGPRKKVA